MWRRVRSTRLWIPITAFSFLVLLCGCYHVKPMAVPSSALRATSPEKLPVRIYLALGEKYRSYVSYDRGHWAADPQSYEIGPSLAALTEAIFELYFEEVTTGTRLPEWPLREYGLYAVEMKIDDFDNKLRFFAGTQTLAIRLLADLYDAAGEPLANGLVGEHEVTYFIDRLRTSQDRISRELSEAVEEAVKQVVEKVHSSIERNLADKEIEE